MCGSGVPSRAARSASGTPKIRFYCSRQQEQRGRVSGRSPSEGERRKGEHGRVSGSGGEAEAAGDVGALPRAELLVLLPGLLGALLIAHKVGLHVVYEAVPTREEVFVAHEHRAELNRMRSEREMS